MNAVRKVEAPEPYKHSLKCTDCPREISVEEKSAQIARRRCFQEAREADWILWKEQDEWHGRCPPCNAALVRLDSERKLILRAQNRKAEEKRIREAKRDAEARRATKPVGQKIAKEDTTLTRDTPKLIHRNNFERYTYGKLDGPQRNAADQFVSLTEASQGVSDKELYQEKTDGGTNKFEPQGHQLDALEKLRHAKAAVGPFNYAVLEHAIDEDALPSEIGARLKWLTNDRDRALVGGSLVRVALNVLARHWGMM